jgi:hypothetical protein
MFFDSRDIITKPEYEGFSRSLLKTYLIQHPEYGLSYVYYYAGFEEYPEDQALKTKFFNISKGSDAILDKYNPKFYKICTRFDYDYLGNDISVFNINDNNSLYVNTRNEFRDYGKIEDFEKNFIPPDSVCVLDKAENRMLVNNTEVSVIMTERLQERETGSLGETNWIIHDKLKDKWYIWMVEGSQTSIRAFKDQWIGGIIMGSFNRSFRSWSEEEINNEVSDRGEGRCASGWADTNSDKRLYAYNAGTRQYLEFPTEYYYAELLYVDNEELYYRDDDAIYRRKITADGLGEPELIIENDYVLNIHWMYKKIVRSEK